MLTPSNAGDKISKVTSANVKIQFLHKRWRITHHEVRLLGQNEAVGQKIGCLHLDTLKRRRRNLKRQERASRGNEKKTLFGKKVEPLTLIPQ